MSMSQVLITNISWVVYNYHLDHLNTNNHSFQLMFSEIYRRENHQKKQTKVMINFGKLTIMIVNSKMEVGDLRSLSKLHLNNLTALHMSKHDITQGHNYVENKGCQYLVKLHCPSLKQLHLSISTFN